MKIICAGFPKTGTTSLAKALRLLGYEMYDFDEHMSNHLDVWYEFFKNNKPIDFKTLYEDIEAVTDAPPCFFFDEILEAFPDSKVILSVRDSDEVWVDSLVRYRSLLGSLKLFQAMYWLTPTGRKYSTTLSGLRSFGFSTPKLSATHMIRKRYNAHNALVTATVPKDKLLVLNLKEGWAPLCKFLDVEVPDCPFPRENVGSAGIKSKRFNQSRWLKQMKKELIERVEVFCGLLFLGLVLYLAIYVTE